MKIGYILLNLAPYAPLFLLTAILVWWLRALRDAWIAAVLIAVCVPGIILTWYLRDVGFNAFGASCSPDMARGFMEMMQFVFVLQSISGFIGSIWLGAVAMRRNPLIGWVSIVALTFVSILTGLFIYFAAGMTAVDGYRC